MSLKDFSMFQKIKEVLGFSNSVTKTSNKIDSALVLFELPLGRKCYTYNSISPLIKIHEVLNLTKNSMLPKHTKYYLTDSVFYFSDRLTNELLKLSYNDDNTLSLTLFSDNFKVKSKFIRNITNTIKNKIDSIDKVYIRLSVDNDYDDSEDGF